MTRRQQWATGLVVFLASLAFFGGGAIIGVGVKWLVAISILSGSLTVWFVNDRREYVERGRTYRHLQISQRMIAIGLGCIATIPIAAILVIIPFSPEYESARNVFNLTAALAALIVGIMGEMIAGVALQPSWQHQVSARRIRG